MTFTVVAEAATNTDTRVYAEGWQSWSPVGWFRPNQDGPRPELDWQHLMRFRPGSDLPRHGLQAEGLLVVDAGDTVTRIGAVGPGAVPTIRCRLLPGGSLQVAADGPVEVSTHATIDAAFTAWSDRFAPGLAFAAAPRVWCSWYRYFEAVRAADIERDLAEIERLELPVEVIQIDDGWSPGFGEGAVVADAFGSLPRLVDRIRSSGRRAGLWLAPFLVGSDTTLARQHPDWLTGPAGFTWGQNLVGLDLTHPGVTEYLRETVQRLCGLGIDYLKLDFLYGGAVPGRRHTDVDAIEAYRGGLATIREAAGPDVLLLGCGAPLLPSVGLVDAMRVSPDTFHEGGEDGSAGLRGAPGLIARAWQHERLWVNDPDCLVARPSFALREQWADVLARHPGLRSFSDRIDELDEWGLAAVRRHLAGSTAPADATASRA